MYVESFRIFSYADCRVSSTFKWKGMWTQQQPSAPQVFSSPATPSAGEEDTLQARTKHWRTRTVLML